MKYCFFMFFCSKHASRCTRMEFPCRCTMLMSSAVHADSLGSEPIPSPSCKTPVSRSGRRRDCCKCWSKFEMRAATHQNASSVRSAHGTALRLTYNVYAAKNPSTRVIGYAQHKATISRIGSHRCHPLCCSMAIAWWTRL